MDGICIQNLDRAEAGWRVIINVPEPRESPNPACVVSRNYHIFIPDAIAGRLKDLAVGKPSHDCPRCGKPGDVSNFVKLSSPPQYDASCSACQVRWTFSGPKTKPSRYNESFPKI